MTHTFTSIRKGWHSACINPSAFITDQINIDVHNTGTAKWPEWNVSYGRKTGEPINAGKNIGFCNSFSEAKKYAIDYVSWVNNPDSRCPRMSDYD